MKTWAGRALLLVGAFLLLVGAVALFWAGDAAKRTPLDTDSWTRLTGEASGALVDADDITALKPVAYWVHTQADPDASDSDVVAFREESCIMVDEDNPPTESCPNAEEDDRVISGPTIERFATDRNTAEAVADQTAYIPDSEVAYQGLINKFPFDPESRDYQYWDGTIGGTATAAYVGEQEIQGIEVYQYQVDIPETSLDIAEDTPGTYTAAQTLWVDQLTGAFIDQTGSQTLATTDGTVVLDIDVEYSDETVARNVDDAEANATTLTLVTVVLPLVGLIGGVIVIAIGALLIVRRRPSKA